MTRIVQISDTHLSPRKTHFAGNWQPLCEWIGKQNPDLIIHTGDVSVDGADVDEDLAYCAALLRQLGTPVLTVPGNHDIGEANHPHQPVNGSRLARWRQHFGNDYWHRDIGNWRIVGLNSMLFGNGDDEEARQSAWLEKTMADSDGRLVAWFTHRPLFIEHPAEGGIGYWAAPPAARKRLMKTIGDGNVRFVASGHLHRSHDIVVDDVRYVWGPASGFLAGEALQPSLPGARTLGAVVYDLDEAAVRHEIVSVDGLQAIYIDDIIHEVYPLQPVG